MKTLLLFSLLAASLSAAPLLTGPASAITGQQSVFSVRDAVEPFVWVAVPPGETDANARRVNDNKPALVTSWQGRPGKWRVWVEDAAGRSNEIGIDVLADSVETTQLVPDPTAVVNWSEMMQASPRGASSAELAAVAKPSVAKRLIPRAPDTPIPSASAAGAPHASPAGEDTSNAIAADEDGTPVIIPANADNVVDLAAQLVEPEVPGALRNPFVRVRSGVTKPRELQVTLSAVVLGPRASAVMNDQIHTSNDSVAGTLLRVSEITRDYVTLRTGRFLVRIPIDVPTTIRLPN